jgi:hypothetical protein
MILPGKIILSNMYNLYKNTNKSVTIYCEPQKPEPPSVIGVNII